MEEYLVKLMRMDFVNLRIKLGSVWYTGKTLKIPIKLWHSASTTAVCSYEDLGVLHHNLDDSASESIRNQQSNDEDGGPGLSLVENATILRSHRQRGSKTRGING